MNRFLTLAGTAAVLAVMNVSAQDAEAVASAPAALEEKITSVEGKVNGLEETYLETKGTVDKLAKIQVSGYVQAQLRLALQGKDAQSDSTADTLLHKYNYKVGDFAGGTFAENTMYQFQVRRARLKVAYAGGFSSAVIQLDIAPDGVKLKDAYVKLTEPRFGSFGIQAGFMDRPFGYEIGSCEESPERSRMTQILFPGEKDLGGTVTFDASDKLPKALKFFNLKAGAFTGNGVAVENDRNLDGIGRLGVKIPLANINLSIDGGFSMYRGQITNYTDTVYTYDDAAFKWVKDSTKNKWTTQERRYTGGDLQIYKDLPVIGGLILKGEVVGGQQPGTSIASPSSAAVNATGLNVRDFAGFYVQWVQNINPINSQFVLKFDSFDPNTKVDGDDVGKKDELAYKTLGLGLNYYSQKLSGVKYTVYWDHPMNETSAKLGFYSKDLKDDVLTVRAQVKF